MGQAAKTLHLDTCLRRKPCELSGGQRQRVAIGRAIRRRPRLLRLGKPLPKLDAVPRAPTLVVVGFIGSPAMNVLKATGVAQNGGRTRIRLALGAALDIPLAASIRAGSPVMLGIRPEHMDLGAEARVATPTTAALVVAMLGNDTFIPPRPGHESVVIRDGAARPLCRGDAVTVALPAAACHIFDASGRRLPQGDSRPASGTSA